MTSRRTGESPTAAPRPPSLTALSAPASPWRPTHHRGEAPGALSAGTRATALLPVGLVGWMVGRDGLLAVSYRSAVSLAIYSKHPLARVPLVERVVVELVVAVELWRHVHLRGEKLELLRVERAAFQVVEGG